MKEMIEMFLLFYLSANFRSYLFKTEVYWRKYSRKNPPKAYFFLPFPIDIIYDFIRLGKDAKMKTDDKRERLSIKKSKRNL